MALEQFKQLLSVTATISTIIQFMTGLIVCWSISKKGASGDISGFPFLAGVLGCSLWLRYGMLLDDWAMIVVNTVGVTLQLGYTILFYYYATQKVQFQKQVIVVLSIIVATNIYVQWEQDVEESKFRLGLLGCATTLVFCSAPLASLGDVMRTRSTETLPFHLILATVLVSGQWFLYGMAIHNPFVQIPNLIGCLIASFQLLLFAVFPNSSSVRGKIQAS